jgi:hypothetical protein
MRGAYGRQETIPHNVRIDGYTSVADEILPTSFLRLRLPSFLPVLRQSWPKAAVFPANHPVVGGLACLIIHKSSAAERRHLFSPRFSEPVRVIEFDVTKRSQPLLLKEGFLRRIKHNGTLP